MPKEKAAIFVDNSNIFKGMHQFTRLLQQQGKISSNEVLRLNWANLLEFLEGQFGDRDIFARHFFASIPPAVAVEKLTGRPSEEEWQELIRRSAQSGFYRAIQERPCGGFDLHPIPLKLADVFCRGLMRSAAYRCTESWGGQMECGARVDVDTCFDCTKKFLKKYEKGLDVALSVEIVRFVAAMGRTLDTVIIAAGDGDYSEAASYARREAGKEIQIVSWRRPLAKSLAELATQRSVILDDHWEDSCFHKPRREVEDEIPVEVAEELEEEE